MGIRISANTPEGACKRIGPSPAGCSSIVVPTGSSRFSKLHTPTYCEFRSGAASSSSGTGGHTRAGGLTAWPSRARATVAAGRSSSRTRTMVLASAAGKVRHLTPAVDSAEPNAASAEVVGALSTVAVGADASNATQGWSTNAPVGGGTALSADSGTTTAVAPMAPPAARAAMPPFAPP